MSARTVAACIAISGLVVSAHAANRDGDGVEVQVIVTVADHMNHNPPLLTKKDIDSTPSMRVASITPIYGDRELYIVVDDAANYDFGAKLLELRAFVHSQPPSTAIGLAFVTDGKLKIAQTPVKDRDLVAHALRAPAGSEPANPWCAVSSLLAGWRADVAQRAVLVVTSGMGPAAACAGAETTIAQAQRAGIEIYAIYHPVEDYQNEEWRQVDTGVVELAHVCYETGGEAYFISHGPMETVTPFLDDISEHLANQYRVKVFFDPQPQAGFRNLYLHPASPRLELMAPSKVWVEGAGH